jgi:hypothetical protein
MRPERFLPVLEATPEPIADRDELVAIARQGIDHPRLPRLAHAEQAASGRARCRMCHEIIEKESFRIALQVFEGGRFGDFGYIHLACSEGYFGTRELLDRISKLTPALSPAARDAIAAGLREQRSFPPDVDPASASALAKTLPTDAERPKSATN